MDEETMILEYQKIYRHISNQWQEAEAIFKELLDYGADSILSKLKKLDKQRDTKRISGATNMRNRIEYVLGVLERVHNDEIPNLQEIEQSIYGWEDSGDSSLGSGGGGGAPVPYTQIR